MQIIITGCILLFLIAAGLIRLATSPAREYDTDNEAARIADTPDGLISALQKIETGTAEIPLEEIYTTGTSSGEGKDIRFSVFTSHLFTVNPFKSGEDWIVRLFNTHPPHSPAD